MVCGRCGGNLVYVAYPTCSVKACSRCDPEIVDPDGRCQVRRTGAAGD